MPLLLCGHLCPCPSCGPWLKTSSHQSEGGCSNSRHNLPWASSEERGPSTSFIFNRCSGTISVCLSSTHHAEPLKSSRDLSACLCHFLLPLSPFKMCLCFDFLTSFESRLGRFSACSVRGALLGMAAMVSDGNRYMKQARHSGKPLSHSLLPDRSSGSCTALSDQLWLQSGPLLSPNQP